MALNNQHQANGEDFRRRFSRFFLRRNLLPKQYVTQIHNVFLVPGLGYSRIKHDENRNINVYFQNYANRENEIMQYIEANREQIASTIFKNYNFKNLDFSNISAEVYQ